ncbi:uncharacterized protein DNG_08767 [Cephalotrichum gorgonifer]|uniref:superoxide dismutase n=1 Tax=Cephalotrichum gorgonifer TaxID=2041049 RepID=A0AAE8N673_9PEZI|nr:uncharacterized protein DNG_08767 [Cephalotrichum gorgonifer]
MRTTYALLAAAAGALAQSTRADEVVDNPAGARYIARFETDLYISGRVLVGSDPFGIGASYHVQLSGLPDNNGPFKYHIHQLPVPASGNCTETGGHLDPFGRTDDPACDEEEPQTCEVGDLSGKHGPLQGSADDISFLDLYTSLNPESRAFIGNRSVVIHGDDGTRLACANFQLVPDETQVEPTPVETPDEEEEETPVETPVEETPVETTTPPAETTTPPAETTAPEEPEDDECEAEEEDEVIETPDTPAEEAPVEEAPVEEAPVEEEDPVIETPTSP